MTTKPQDLMMNAWKQQLGAAFRSLESITEEFRKMREFQLTSAVQAHASTVAMRERLEKASDAQELWRIQGEWWSANLNRSLAYWREAFEGMVRTQASLAQCLRAPGDVPKANEATMPSGALFDMMGDAYKRWLETAGKIYSAPARAAADNVREAA